MSWGEYITGASGLMGHYNKIEQAGIFATGSKFNYAPIRLFFLPFTASDYSFYEHGALLLL